VLVFVLVGVKLEVLLKVILCVGVGVRLKDTEFVNVDVFVLVSVLDRVCVFVGENDGV
jgi:hypothetical protein